MEGTAEKRLSFFYFRTEVRQNQPCPQFRVFYLFLFRTMDHPSCSTSCVSKGAPASLSLRVCTGPCLSRREYPSWISLFFSRDSLFFFNYNGHRRYPGTQCTRSEIRCLHCAISSSGVGIGGCVLRRDIEASSHIRPAEHTQTILICPGTTCSQLSLLCPRAHRGWL